MRVGPSVLAGWRCPGNVARMLAVVLLVGVGPASATPERPDHAPGDGGSGPYLSRGCISGHCVAGNVVVGTTDAPVVGVEVRLLEGETAWQRAVRLLSGEPRKVVARAHTDRVGAFELTALQPGLYALGVDGDPKFDRTQANLLVNGRVELGTWPLLEGTTPPGRLEQGELALVAVRAIDQEHLPFDVQLDPSEAWGPRAHLFAARRGPGSEILAGVPGAPPRRCRSDGCRVPGPTRAVKLDLRVGTSPVEQGVVTTLDGWPLGISGADGTVELEVEREHLGPLLVWTADGRRVHVEVPPRTDASPIRVELPARTPVIAIEALAERGPVWVATAEGWSAVLASPGLASLALGTTSRARLRAVEGLGAAGQVIKGRAALRSAPLEHREIRVVDAYGEVIPTAEVEGSQRVSGPRFRVRRLVDQRGSVRIDGWRFGPGMEPVQLVVRAPGFVPTRRELDASKPGGPGQQLLVVLERATRARLAVVDVDGEPVAGARVVVSTGPGGIRRSPDHMILSEATTDAAGRAVLEVPSPFAALPGSRPPATWQLDVSAAGYARLQLPGIVPEATVGTATGAHDSSSEPDQQVVDLGVVELEPGSAVEVQTVDDQGVPVAGVEVAAAVDELELYFFARGFGSEFVVLASTNSTGRASVGAFRLDEVVHLRAGSPARVPAVGTARAGGEVVVLTLAPTVSLSGRVIDVDGRPVAGATITASPLDSGASTWPVDQGTQASTDHSGSFSLDGLRPGRVMLYARAPGCETHFREVRVPSEEKVELVLQPALDLVVEVRTTSGQPIENATVEIARAQGGLTKLEAVRGATNAAGQVLVRGVAIADVLISVEARGYASREVGRSLTTADDGATLEITLEGGVRLGGRVSSPSGPPAAAKIRASGHGWLRETTPDSTGSFELGPAAPGTTTVTVVAEGWQTHEETLMIGEDHPDLVILLEPEARIEGQLVGLDAAEAAAATVGASSTGSPRGGYTHPAWDGTFAIGGLAAGTYRVTARSGDGAVASVEVTLGAGEILRGLELELTPGRLVTGTVWFDGELAVGAQVRAFGPGPPQPASTDMVGQFELRLEPGRWGIRVFDADGRNGEEVVEVADEDLELELRFNSELVEVRVVDDRSGAPIEGAQVELWPRSEIGGRSAGGRSDDGGLLTLRVSAGPWDIRVDANGYNSYFAEIEAKTSPIEVGMVELGRRELRITTGGPLPDLVLPDLVLVERLTPHTGWQEPTVVVLDASGTGTLEGFPGVVEVVVAAPGFAPEVVSTPEGGPLLVSLSPRVPVIVEFEGAGPLLMHATDEAGRPWIEVMRWGSTTRSLAASGGTLELSAGRWIVEGTRTNDAGESERLRGELVVDRPGQRLVLLPVPGSE